MITTILFDADGVLIRGELASSYFEQTYGIPHEKLIAFYRGPFLDCLLDKRDMYEVLPAYLAEWGYTKSPEAFAQEWFDFEHNVDEELIGYIQDLRARGLQCYVATNQERHRAQYLLEKLGFAKSFDGMFASAQLGSAKPDVAFFEKILARLAITDKSSVLFWDDMLTNVTVAEAFGMHAEVYSEFAHFSEVMKTKYQLPAQV
jgi:putative hydrolase of the HAD superfamily